MILVDTDGDVTRLVPWLLREGIHGVLAAGTAGGRGRPEASPAVPRPPHGGALQQDGHESRRGGDARRIRAARAADENRRIHPQRRSPEPRPAFRSNNIAAICGCLKSTRGFSPRSPSVRRIEICVTATPLLPA